MILINQFWLRIPKRPDNFYFKSFVHEVLTHSLGNSDKVAIRRSLIELNPLNLSHNVIFWLFMVHFVLETDYELTGSMLYQLWKIGNGRHH